MRAAAAMLAAERRSIAQWRSRDERTHTRLCPARGNHALVGMKAEGLGRRGSKDADLMGRKKAGGSQESANKAPKNPEERKWQSGERENRSASSNVVKLIWRKFFR